MVERAGDERFHVFISHKHDDHALAMAVHGALESLSPHIECFVSGTDISAGADWNREIKSRLAVSHLLVLLFTWPSSNWDWCLFETGLFAKFDADELSAIVCIFGPDGESPRPLASLQGVAAVADDVRRFLGALCKETWRVSEGWRRGPLAPRVRPAQLERAVATIVGAFPTAPPKAATTHPCHRVVLDLSHNEPPFDGIPTAARVVVGDGKTSSYTLSLFNLTDGRRTITWGDLVDALDGEDSGWRQQLDRRFVAALNEELFSPTTATLRAWHQGRRQQRPMKPMLYRVARAPVAAGAEPDERGRPLEVTIVLDPQRTPAGLGNPALNLVRINARFATDVFEEFAGCVRDRALSDGEVFVDIREALRDVYEDADRYGVFDEQELRRVYGESFDTAGIAALGDEWERELGELHRALDACDAGKVETELAALSRLNRTFSTLSAERYLASLQAG
jgi:hypothetical protein